jgi:transposase-like protein
MKTLQEVKTTLMKIVVRVADVVELARKFEQSPKLAMREIVDQMHHGFGDALESVMKAEIELFLGRPEEASNKRNGYTRRTFGVKGIGSVALRVPRDR